MVRCVCSAEQAPRTQQQMVQLETKILTAVDFRITLPTVHTYLNRYIRAGQVSNSNSSSSSSNDSSSNSCISTVIISISLIEFSLWKQLSQLAVCIARCICERSLLEYSMLNYLPSLIAASAVAMTRAIISGTSVRLTPDSP